MDVHIQNRLAVGSYRPAAYPGSLTPFRSGLFQGQAAESGEDRYLGWARLADVIDVHDVAGDHFSIMEFPAVTQIADLVLRYLADEPVSGKPATAR